MSSQETSNQTYVAFIMIRIMRAVILVQVMMKVTLCREIGRPKRDIKLNALNIQRRKSNNHHKAKRNKDAAKDTNEMIVY